MRRTHGMVQFPREDLDLMSGQGARASHPARIAYVFTDLPDQAGTFPYVELQEMAKRGFEIEIFCLRSRLADGPDAGLLRAGFPVHRTGYMSPRALAAALRVAILRPALFWKGFFGCVRETASKPKILVKTLAIIPKCCLFAESIRADRFDWIQAYWASLPARAAWWISSISGVRYGTWAHAGADIYNREHQTEPALRAVIEKASLVLTCNKTNLEYLLSLLPAAHGAKVTYHPHGVDMAAFSPDPAKAPAAADAVFRMLSVGRISEAKGFEHAVRACRLLADAGVAFHYRVIGGGEGKAALETLIDTFGLRDRIELTGPLEQSALPAEYRAADLFIVPSVIGRRGARDGLPNVLLEAMACGLPAVGSNVAAIPEAIEDGRTGMLVPPADPGALCAAVASLARDPVKRLRLGADARALVESRYARASCMDALAGIYASAIGRPAQAKTAREGKACESFS